MSPFKLRGTGLSSYPEKNGVKRAGNAKGTRNVDQGSLMVATDLDLYASTRQQAECHHTPPSCSAIFVTDTLRSWPEDETANSRQDHEHHGEGMREEEDVRSKRLFDAHSYSTFIDKARTM